MIDIITRVKSVEDPPFRPTLPMPKNTKVNAELLKLMNACWFENPEERPDFDTIKRKLVEVNSGRYVANSSGDITEGQNMLWIYKYIYILYNIFIRLLLLDMFCLRKMANLVDSTF